MAQKGGGGEKKLMPALTRIKSTCTSPVLNMKWFLVLVFASAVLVGLRLVNKPVRDDHMDDDWGSECDLNSSGGGSTAYTE